MSACLTQLRIVEAEGSNSRASASGDRPECARATICRRYADGYRLRFLDAVGTFLSREIRHVDEDDAVPIDIDQESDPFSQALLPRSRRFWDEGISLEHAKVTVTMIDVTSTAIDSHAVVWSMVMGR